MEKQEFGNACYEVLEILKYIKEEDLEKIPQEEIQILKKNANYNHSFYYNPGKSIKEQEVSKLSKGIIAQYFCKYIATEKVKEKIKLKQEYDLQIIESEKRKKYDYNNIFKEKQNVAEKDNEKINNVLPIEYKKEKWYVKIFNKILNFFKR